ncbi:hypothetical protein [Streptomyces sp. NPDC053048]|uniref:hypothetical protein n=1 Tax=Streptomyces sp. NPDC053048 TaxID=3365694 RepID=UPI0037CD50CB
MTSGKSSGSRAGQRIVERLSDDSLRKNTGRGWAEWFTVLDEAEAVGLGHSAIARLLTQTHDVPGWYAHSITVGYEQERGLREVGQTCAGDYQAGGNKTVNAAAGRVIDAFVDDAQRRAWLPDADFAVRTHRPAMSVTADWDGGSSRVSVYLVIKSEAKTQISLSHTKLSDAEAVATYKAFWKERLAALKEVLESSGEAGSARP